MRITIRQATLEDAYDYTDCHISCWHSAYKGIMPDDFLGKMKTEMQQRVERCKNTLANPGDSEYYCVMYAGNMIGRLIIGKSNVEDKFGVGEIGAIYLKEEYWGRGFGKEMLDYAINHLTQMGHKDILIWVLEKNNRARRFYEKNGFCFDGIKREAVYGKPLVLLRYILHL